MLVLKSLEFQNIGRFVEPQKIDFTQLGSLVQLEGVNNNTGGSSGAGKSTIFKALNWCLGLDGPSTTSLQSRLTKSLIQVTADFDYDGVPLKVERGKKLLIDLNGEITTGSSKLTEEKLDQIIGMPRDLFRKILNKKQGEQGFFLNMGPSDTHKFLTSCLGLEKEQAKIVTLDARLESLSNTDSSLKSSISALQMAQEATQNAIASLGLPPILEIDPGAIETLKAKHLEATNTHLMVKNGVKAEMDSFDKSRPQITTISFDRSHIENLERQIDLIVVQIANLEKVESDRQSAVKSKSADLRIEASRLASVEQTRQSDVKAKIAELQAHIRKSEKLEQDRQTEVKTKLYRNNLAILTNKAISENGNNAKLLASDLAKELQKVKSAICPKCEQGWVNDAAKLEEASILEKLQGCKKLVIAGMAADTTLISLEKEKLQLNSELPSLPPSMQVEEFMAEVKALEIEVLPKPIPGMDAIRAQMEQISIEAQPQTIPEAIELKLKKDFKDKELKIAREEERNHQSKENAKNQAILAEFAQKQTALRQSHETTLKYVRDEEAKALAEYESANNKVRSFEETKKRYDESRNKLEDQFLNYANQLIDKRLELNKTTEEIELATESKKAIKSYLSCSFEDGLDSIGDAATRLIRSIPNMSTATVQFEGLRETQQGKVKEQVTCIVHMDGEIGIPIDTISGGERSSIDIGIDLSVIAFIEERTGKGIDILGLDEFTGGLDTVCIENAIEMLRNSNMGKRLLLVEHNPIAAQTIDSKIIVTRTGLTSTIEQQ